jgi:hypothetical protein
MKLRYELTSFFLSLYLGWNLIYVFYEMYHAGTVFIFPSAKSFISPLEILSFFLLYHFVLVAVPFLLACVFCFNVFIFIVRRQKYTTIFQFVATGIVLGFVIYLPALFFSDSINSNWFLSMYYGGSVASCFWVIQKILNMTYNKSLEDAP